MKNVHKNPEKESITIMEDTYPVALIYQKPNQEGYQCMFPGCYYEDLCSTKRDVINHIEEYHPKDEILCKKCKGRTKLQFSELCDKCTNPYKNCVICGDKFKWTRDTDKVCKKPECKAENTRIQASRNINNKVDKLKSEKSKPKRSCKICKKDISDLHHAARTCEGECRDINWNNTQRLKPQQNKKDLGPTIPADAPLPPKEIQLEEVDEDSIPTGGFIFGTPLQTIEYEMSDGRTLQLQLIDKMVVTIEIIG